MISSFARMIFEKPNFTLYIMNLKLKIKINFYK